MSDYELKFKTFLEALGYKPSKVKHVLEADLSEVRDCAYRRVNDIIYSHERELFLISHGLGLKNCEFLTKLYPYELKNLLESMNINNDKTNLNKLLIILHKLGIPNKELEKFIKLNPCNIVHELPKLCHETDYKILNEKLESLLQGLNLDVETCKELSSEELKAIGEQILRDMI